MTTAPTQLQPAASPALRLRQRLAAVTNRRHALALLTLALQLLAIALQSLLLIMLLDAVWPMNPAGRIAALATALTLAIVFYFRARPRRELAEIEQFREAARLEHARTLPSNPLVNGLWLSQPLHQPPPDLSRALSNRAVEQARSAADAIDPRAVIDTAPGRRAAFTLALTLAAWLLTAAIQPTFLTTGFARLINPFADHPPFSLTRFNLSVNPQKPLRGQDALLTADLTGKLPDSAQLVALDRNNAELTRWPLATTHRDSNRWTLQRNIQSIREPITLYLQTPTGRSKRITITPIDPPPQQVAQPQPSPTITPQPQSPTTLPADRDAQLRLTTAKISSLSDALRRLQALAADLAARSAQQPPAAPLPDWIRDRLDEILRRAADQTRDAQSLAKLLEQLADECEAAGDAISCESLRQLARQLKDAKVPALTAGIGAGRGSVSPSELAKLLDQLRDAANHDARLLDQLLDQFPDAVGASSGRQPDEPSQPLHDQNTLPGPVVHHVVIGGTQVDLTAAQLQAVPPVYRDLVARYFERLSKDQKPANP